MIYKPEAHTLLVRPNISDLARLFRETNVKGLAAFSPQNALNEVITPAVVKRFKVPTTVKSGDPIILGGGPNNELKGLAAVAQTAYDSRDGMATLMFEGSHNLTVTAQSGSPQAGAIIKPGDTLFAAIFEAGAAYDATTNCWTGFVLDNNSGGIPFGNYWDTTNLSSAFSGLALVRLKFGGGNA